MTVGLAASRFNIFVPLLARRQLAYNSLSGATAIWEPVDVDVYESIVEGREVRHGDATAKEMLYGGFVLPSDVDELAFARASYEMVRGDRSKMVLTIAPTLMCNFGCDYCFQGADKPSGTMPAAVQDAVVDLVASAPPAIKQLHVAWYGGEPLLALSVIEQLSDRLLAACATRGIAYDGFIVTNGYNLSATRAQSLLARQVRSAQVTLDGAASEHDRRRHRLGGGGSFDRIVENLKAVVETTALSVSVRVNVDVRNKDSVFGLLEELAALGLSRRKNFGVYFAPVEAITAGCHSVADHCLSKSEYGAIETEMAKRAFDLGLAALPYPPRFRGVCGAIRPHGFVILPNGDVHKCWDTVAMAEHRVGTVFDREAMAHDLRRQSWESWTPFDNEVCRSCKILPNCAGSCAHKFLNADQTLGEAGSLPCPSWKYNINERLVWMAERSGALTPQDYDREQIATDSRSICPAAPVPNARPRRVSLPIAVVG